MLTRKLMAGTAIVAAMLVGAVQAQQIPPTRPGAPSPGTPAPGEPAPGTPGAPGTPVPGVPGSSPLNAPLTPGGPDNRMEEFTGRIDQGEFQVREVDRGQRTMLITGPDGQPMRVRVDESARQFENVQPNQRIQVQMVRPIALQILPPDAPMTPARDIIVLNVEDPATAATRKVMTRSMVSVATVENVNRNQRTITLSLPNGGRQQFWVDQNVDLTQFNQGDRVRVRHTEAVILNVGE